MVRFFNNRRKGVTGKEGRFVMNEDGTVLTDGMWSRMESVMSGGKGDRGVAARDNRPFLEGVLRRIRTGCPWRDLPPRFGKRNGVFQRFRRLAGKGVFERVFTALSDDPDFEHVFVDGTTVPAHRKASGAKGGGLGNRGLAVPGAD